MRVHIYSARTKEAMVTMYNVVGIEEHILHFTVIMEDLSGEVLKVSFLRKDYNHGYMVEDRGEYEDR